METYLEMKKRHQDEVNKLPIKWAFSNKQFEEACASLGVTDPKAELYAGFSGGFYRKTDAKHIWGTLKRHDEEMEAAMHNEEFAVSAFRYEAGNHEYHINLDPNFDMANCFGYPFNRKEERIEWEKVSNGEFLQKCYNKGVNEHIAWCREHDAY